MYSNSLNSSVAWYWRALFIVVLVCYGERACDVSKHVVAGGVIVIQGVEDSPIVRAYIEYDEVVVSVVPYTAYEWCV